MYKYIFKRWLDFIIALLAMPFFIPVLIIVSPLIWLDDPGPIFYNAPRLGYKGKVFKMYKFRSMKVNAPDIRNEDGTTYNSENDPRVTRVGRILRKTSIDELPQLLNVLKGDMSLIGPRPDLPGAEKEVYRPGDKKKLTVKPGITGYSQAYYRNSSTIEQRFNGDVYYAKNVSIILDIKIMIKTIESVLASKNIYRN